MTVPAGIIQTDFRQQCAIRFGELADLGWVDRHCVGAKICFEALWITPGDLDQPWHVAFDAGQIQGSVRSHFMLSALSLMTLIAGDPGGCLAF